MESNLINIKDYLSYNLETGIFTWIKGKGRILPGKVCVVNHGEGYITIGFNGKRYLAHRLAWYFTYGELPKEIDHINGIRNDNRICNLRSVTRRQNSQNNIKHRNGKLVGTHFDTDVKKWRSTIKINGKNKYLGWFNTELGAHKRYIKECNKLKLRDGK
jgi:hypothetical protein